MVMQVNQELCAGCSVCVEICPVGAIQFVDKRAWIDTVICTACEACMEACPNEAIYPSETLEPMVTCMTLPVPDSQPVQFRQQAAILEPASPTRGIAPVTGAMLAYLGREAAPRLIDALVSALERRLARPITPITKPSSSSSNNMTRTSSDKQRQVRYRGGHTAIRNSKERR